MGGIGRSARIGRHLCARAAIAGAMILALTVGAAGTADAAAARPSLGPWPLRYGRATVPHSHDANGIPMWDYNGTLEYNPVGASELALYSDDPATLLRIADWLVSYQQPDGVWPYTFPFAGEPVPWRSAMAEGVGMSVLMRAWQATGKAAYRTAADRALDVMNRTIDRGGVYVWDQGYYWLEEYLPPYAPHTLNGAIVAWQGLVDYALLTGNSIAAANATAALRTFAAWAGRFDTGTWAYYCLGSRPVTASIAYQGFMSFEMRYLATQATSPAMARTFTTYAERWEADLLARLGPGHVLQRPAPATRPQDPLAAGRVVRKAPPRASH